MAIPPFSVISYGSSNPLWVQPNMPVNVGPVPGFSAASYSISASLPTGLSFNTTTGVVSGTPTTLTPATTYVITANLIAGGTTTCNFVVTVTNEPPPALTSNTNSAVKVIDNKLLAQQNWLASVEQMVGNNSQLGIYWANINLTNWISFYWCYNYLTSLNYTVVNLTPSQNDYEFVSYFGQPTAFPGLGGYPYGYDDYSDFGQPYPAVISRPQRKIRISWSVNSCGAYPPFPPYGF